MAQIICTQCGKPVEVPKPLDSYESFAFICDECCAKNNARQIEKEKRINEELKKLVAQGKTYVLAQVVKKVEAEMGGA